MQMNKVFVLKFGNFYGGRLCFFVVYGYILILEMLVLMFVTFRCVVIIGFELGINIVEAFVWSIELKFFMTRKNGIFFFHLVLFFLFLVYTTNYFMNCEDL